MKSPGGLGLLAVAAFAGALGSSLAAGISSRGPAAGPLVRAELTARSCDTPTLETHFEVELGSLRIAEWRDRLLRTPPRLLDAYLSRPDPWMDELLPILKAHDVPPSFLYLALIESGMDPEARSPAEAVGLWQFMPGTARAYGLRIEDETDERTDERLATLAAGRYLRDLFEDFGSWELAAAAYNAGPGRVRQAIGSAGADDYWSLVEGEHLPAETRAYVPKLIAVVRLAAERRADFEPYVIGLGLQ